MLEEALQNYEGAVLVVSHDRYFVSQVSFFFVLRKQLKTYSSTLERAHKLSPSLSFLKTCVCVFTPALNTSVYVRRRRDEIALHRIVVVNRFEIMPPCIKLNPAIPTILRLMKTILFFFSAVP